MIGLHSLNQAGNTGETGMRISAQMTIYVAAVFALVCFGVALNGFTSLGGIDDPAILSDAKGFAWFWAFLGFIAVGMGAVSWWLVRTSPEEH